MDCQRDGMIRKSSPSGLAQSGQSLVAGVHIKILFIVETEDDSFEFRTSPNGLKAGCYRISFGDNAAVAGTLLFTCNQAHLQRFARSLATIFYVHFSQDILYVVFDGERTDFHNTADFPIGFSGLQPFQHFQFAPA